MRFQTVKAEVFPGSPASGGLWIFPYKSRPAEEQGSIIVGLTAMVGFLATGGRAELLPPLCEVLVRFALGPAPARGWFCCWESDGRCSVWVFLRPLSGKQWRLLGLKQFLHSPGFHTCSVKVLQADMAAGPEGQPAGSVDRKALHGKQCVENRLFYSTADFGVNVRSQTLNLKEKTENKVMVK